MTEAEVSGTPLKNTKVFAPIKVGRNTLSHKVVFAPSTRMRATKDHVPSDLLLKYYDDRSKFKGSLIITEGTHPSIKTGLYATAPGIYTDKQVQGWKKVTDKIHQNGSFASVQIWALGRVGDPVVTKSQGGALVSASALYEDENAEKAAIAAEFPVHALTEDEIKDLIYKDYTIAAKNAVEAGFDYVELHGAHGYLLDQFFQPVSNQRTDKYGGSIENRSRFILELIDHLSTVIGADRLAVRISPWAKFQGMLAEEDEVSPVANFSYFLSELERRAEKGQRLAYVSVVEPRVLGIVSVESKKQYGDNEFVKAAWSGVIVRAGNYTYDAPSFKTVIDDVDDERTLVGFSRYYISNPDLVSKLFKGEALNPYDRDTFYGWDNWGYNTYTKSGEAVQYTEEKERLVTPKALV